MKPRVVLIAAEPLAQRMPGPAIRTYELGRALAAHADVVLAAPIGADPPATLALPVVHFHRADARPLEAALDGAAVVVAQPPWPHVAAAIRRSGARFVADLYDPEPFELLETLAGRTPAVRRVADTLTLDRIVSAVHLADHVMCASETQRDLWLGLLLAERLIGPQGYDSDPSLRGRIDVVPFGVPAEAAVHRGAGPRQAAEEELVLWNGGIWDWLDAPTAIRAAGALATTRPNLRLCFMGTTDRGQAARATAEARALAAPLGATVRFNDGWVPYEQRASWLLDADCAISTHREHLETRFAFRTRLLDCIWAGLPIVCTSGDELAERVERDVLGAAVAAGDVAATASALAAVLDRGRSAYGPAMERAREALAWDRAASPLVRWVAAGGTPARDRLGVSPRRARDLGFRAVLRATGRRWWPAL